MPTSKYLENINFMQYPKQDKYDDYCIPVLEYVYTEGKPTIDGMYEVNYNNDFTPNIELFNIYKK